MEMKDPYSFYMEGTNGKAVLLIHGLTGIPAEMKLVARGLNRAGYTIYAPLLAGHGADIKTLTDTSWQDWLQSVMEAAQLLKQKADKVYTAGICVGGKLGMVAAQRLPGTISATAIYSACFRYDGWNVPWFYKLAPLGLPVMVRLPWWRNKTFPETGSLGIKDERMRSFMASQDTVGVIDEFPALSLLQMFHLGSEVKKQLPHMRTPALILHADEDDLSHPRNSRLIARNIGALSQFTMVKNSYHMLHVDRQHPQVIKLTDDFFQQCG